MRKTTQLPNQYEAERFLEGRLTKHGFTLVNIQREQNYDTFVFGISKNGRSGVAEIDYNGKGYNLRIRRGDNKKALVYDNRFNMDFTDMLEEILIYLKTGE